MAKIKILVIDDDLFWHRLLKRLFAGPEYDVQAAASCADGLKMAEQHKPDCILLDFHLGDGDAVSVCSALRDSGKIYEARVVVVSSDPGAEITAYAECRADYFVLKGSHGMMQLPLIVEKVMAQRDAAGVSCVRHGAEHPQVSED